MAKYNADSFKILSDVESIRNSPGMYIGSTSAPTHLIEEILDNSLDECLAGYSDTIIIEMDLNHKLYSISDNGRGIPTEKDIPITISTVLHSGSKFKGSRDVYKICSGRHGVGLVAVNALSKFFQIETVRRNKYSIYAFDNFNLVNKFSTKIDEKVFSTKITFEPDPEIFENIIPDIDRIRHRLLISSIHLPECTFILIIDGKEEIIKLSIDEYFNNYCLDKNDELTNVVNFNIHDKDEYLNIMFCYSLNGNITPKILSSVNLLPVDSGGIHIKLLTNILKDMFASYGKKDNKFTPQDTMYGLRAYIDLSLTEPEFGGQTKIQLINRPSYLNSLFNKLKKLLENYFSENKEQLDLILDRFSEYRRRIESKNIKTMSKKRTSVKYTKLKDCKDPEGELYIVEGDSAAGSLIQARDIKKHAIFPLKGKIPNVVLKKMEILKNKEVQELISTIGTGIGSDFDISKLRYDKIVSVCDEDFDGQHITSLIIVLFGYLLPEIIKQGKLFICKTPLFAINKDKMFIPIWTQRELEEARNGKYSNYILRIKGIGELNPWQAKICIFDNNRKLIPVEYTKDLNKIFKLFSDSEEKRNLLDGDY